MKGQYRYHPTLGPPSFQQKCLTLRMKRFTCCHEIKGAINFDIVQSLGSSKVLVEANPPNHIKGYSGSCVVNIHDHLRPSCFQFVDQLIVCMNHMMEALPVRTVSLLSNLQKHRAKLMLILKAMQLTLELHHSNSGQSNLSSFALAATIYQIFKALKAAASSKSQMSHCRRLTWLTGC